MAVTKVCVFSVSSFKNLPDEHGKIGDAFADRVSVKGNAIGRVRPFVSPPAFELADL